MSEDILLIEKTNNVALLTLNRPEKLNALSGDLQDGYREALAEARDDDDIRVVIITGAGRGFCSGADLTGTPVKNTRRHRTSTWTILAGSAVKQPASTAWTNRSSPR